jgi:Papain family cysteine protease
MNWNLNYVFQKDDPRDYKFKSELIQKELPLEVDLTKKFSPPIYNQLNFGSCTANSTGYLLNFLVGRNYPFISSRAFIYCNSREDVSEDSGASNRETFKAISKHKVLLESKYPYTRENIFRKPPQNIYDIAKTHTTFEYLSVAQTEYDLKSCLSSGFPIVFGIKVYSSFKSSLKSVPFPQKDDKYLGGHSIVLVGYSDTKKTFKFANSWGTGVGDKGYFEIGYDYVLDPKLSSDFWTCKKFI